MLVDALVAFGVSREAMLNRLHKLRAITEDERGQLCSGTGCLFASVGRSVDFGQWVAGVTTRRAPVRVEQRLLDGYRKGRLGIGPVATLLARDAEELREELADAGVTPVFADHDHALSDL
ncbi:MAG: hypothetical protein AB1679_26060 [Actinomycetota bacterium]